ncbi:MAG: hypothetical protein IKM48_07415 [Clostridia bacterium]|nr:hypothetical protein [Clostridia bacterium]
MKKLLYSKCFRDPKDLDWMEGLPSETRKSRLGFLHEVRRFSDYWQIDTEIFQEDQELEVHFYFRWNRFAGTFKYHLDRLLRQCDEMRIPSRKHRPCKSELILIRKDI